MLPSPVIETHHGFSVVRDDYLAGGTKMRFILPYIQARNESEFVYASPAFGYAQLALAHCARLAGKKAVIFTAKRKIPHPLTLAAKEAGAKVFMVPHGYLSNVQSKARKYCADKGAFLIPFGVDVPEAIQYLTKAAVDMNISPKEVWTVAGSGTLSRALQLAWPDAKFNAVEVGKQGSDIGRAKRYSAPEKYEQKAKMPPPFKSSPWYDAKAWRFIKRHASEGALFWNVGA